MVAKCLEGDGASWEILVEKHRRRVFNIAYKFTGRHDRAEDLSQEIFLRPNHPYTEALVAEVPRVDVRRRRFVAIRGEIPSPLDPPRGCHFHPRCPKAFDRCRAEVPALREVAPGHHSACHLNDRPA